MDRNQFQLELKLEDRKSMRFLKKAVKMISRDGKPFTFCITKNAIVLYREVLVEGMTNRFFRFHSDFFHTFRISGLESENKLHFLMQPSEILSILDFYGDEEELMIEISIDDEDRRIGVFKVFIRTKDFYSESLFKMSTIEVEELQKTTPRNKPPAIQREFLAGEDMKLICNLTAIQADRICRTIGDHRVSMKLSLENIEFSDALTLYTMKTNSYFACREPEIIDKSFTFAKGMIEDIVGIGRFRNQNIRCSIKETEGGEEACVLFMAEEEGLYLGLSYDLSAREEDGVPEPPSGIDIKPEDSKLLTQIPQIDVHNGGNKYSGENTQKRGVEEEKKERKIYTVQRDNSGLPLRPSDPLQVLVHRVGDQGTTSPQTVPPIIIPPPIRAKPFGEDDPHDPDWL